MCTANNNRVYVTWVKVIYLILISVTNQMHIKIYWKRLNLCYGKNNEKNPFQAETTIITN